MEEREIFGQRLRQARIKAKLSMEGLCQRISSHLSKQAISKYEHGVMMPNSTLLLELSNALNQDINFFFRPMTFDSERIEISFRKSECMRAKDLKALKISIQDDVERYLEIEGILHCEETVYNPVNPPVEILITLQDMEACALAVREEWHLGYAPIDNTYVLLEENGINVILSEEIPNFDGVSAMVGEKPIIVLNANVKVSERQRFTAMHELAHILFNDYFAKDLTMHEKERMCDAFASELLFPSTVVRQYFSDKQKVSMSELIYIQKRYGISIDAIINKLRNMRIVSDKRYASFYNRKSASPSLNDSVECSRFIEERMSMLEAKVYSALAQSLITETKAASLLRQPLTTVRNNLNAI